MLSHKLRRIIVPSMVIALMGAPVALAGCSRDEQDVPTSEDIDEAAHKQKKTSSSEDVGGGGGSTGKHDDRDTTSYDEEGNPIISTEAGEIVSRTSEDGKYSTSDFILGSAIYGRKTATITNEYRFDTDGIGEWEMVALRDADGYVFAGDEIKPSGLTMTADHYGVLTVNGSESPFGWQQYNDFPQLALGDIGKQMTITMELNDDGMLTVRQDVDGQMMLFKKVATDTTAQPAEGQQSEGQPIEGTPSTETGTIEGEGSIEVFGD